jgi:hypothetical protein
MVYKSEEQAEWARDMMHPFNRQIKWLAENDDGWRADYNVDQQAKWSVHYSFDRSTYYASYDDITKGLEPDSYVGS